MDIEQQNALSRQLAVYGQEMQGKLMALRIFIHGLSGLGIEVAKNLILAGPKSVTIFDSQLVSSCDLGRNFYCKASQIGIMSRAQACIQSLKELNPSINVSIAKEDSIEYIVSNFDCVAIIDCYNRDFLVKLNQQLHSSNKGFIYAGNLGLYGFAFVDFGQNHKVFDSFGEECKLIHIAGITQEQKALVYLHEGKRHGLSDGDTVTFKEVKGMTEINGLSFKIEVKSPDSFSIGDTRLFSPYSQGGIGLEVKVPVYLKSYQLAKSLEYPYAPGTNEMPIASWQKFGVPEQLHIILGSLLSFQANHKRLPAPLNPSDANELKSLVKHRLQQIASKMDIEGEESFKIQTVDQKLIEYIAFYASTQISPVCSFWGGIVCQQIVKFTGKYTPLRQWLHHEFFEVLPSQPVRRSFSKDRYEDYHILFGDEFVKRAKESRSFVVGAGALGCEFIKMFALMGVGSKGETLVTDDDNIEISNLNRQFLFRRKHVGQNKSETACKVGNIINPQAHFNSLKLRVTQQNQHIFNDDFWSNLTFVVNAVDNVNARQFVDNQCVWFQKPLFESGTLGTKCHSQIIIPHSTISYSDIVDPPEQSIPLCTLKNFPYQIQHTIQWARDYFEGIFCQSSSDLLKFFEDRQSFLADLCEKFKKNNSQLKARLQSMQKLLLANAKKNYQTCVEHAIDIFQDVFNYRIQQLLILFPADCISDETKKPFWSGLKRVPQPLQFDLKDKLHLELIQSAANIYATIFKIPLVKDVSVVAEIAAKVKLAPFTPKKNVKITTDQSKKVEQFVFNDEDQEYIDALLPQLKNYQIDLQLAPASIEFEKDDPTNFHIEFMGAISNLRARNYHIEEADNFKIKLIAGKIIPAIATTTASVVGAVGIQIIKYLLGKKGQAFKNLTANLALPLLVFNQPTPAQINIDSANDVLMGGPVKVVPGKFTKWDKIDINGPMTVLQLKKYFELTYGIQVSMITHGPASLWPSFGAASKQIPNKRIDEAIEAVTKRPIPQYKRFLPLAISAYTKDDIYCLMPIVRYQR